MRTFPLMPPSLSAPLRQIDRLRRDVQAEVRRLSSDLRARVASQVQGKTSQEHREPREWVPTVVPYPHVEPHPRGWAIRREGSEAAQRLFSTRQAALGVAVDLAEAGGLPVVVHREDGTIEEIIALL